MRRSNWLVLLGFGLVAGVSSAQRDEQRIRYDGHAVVEVTPENAGQLESALAAAETLWSERVGIGPIHLVADEAQRESLRELGLAPRVVIENVQGLIDAERAQIEALGPQGGDDFFLTYHPLDEIIERVDQLVQAHPALATRSVIGQSLEGREIVAVDITGPGDASERPALIFNGCQHAREWISPAAVTFFLESMLEGYGDDPRITRILDNAVIKIVPVVNPDGYVFTWQTDRLWRKNRRNNGGGSFGVDPNRNWAFGFGGPGSSGNPDSQVFRGPSAFSEPETRAVRDYILDDPRVEAHIDFHSFSQVVLYPFGHANEFPPQPERDFFERFGAELAGIIESVSGQAYPAMRIWDFSNAAGNMTDWTFSTGIKGWTIELRPTSGGAGGFILPPEQILPTAEENLPAVLAMAEELALPVRFGSGAPLPRVLDADEATTFEVEIKDGAGELDPGSPRVRYTLDVGGGPVTDALTPIGEGVYRVELPALGCGRSLEYAIEAESTDGRVVRLPAGDAVTARSVIEDAVFADDMESDRGWSVGAPGDTATTGIWERADPEPTDAQPGSDSTPDGTLAWVTGADAGGRLGANDIDDGATTLTSPLLDATPPADWHEAEMVVRYARWYSNDKGDAPNDDAMSVELTTDGGSSWVSLEEARDNFEAWIAREFSVADFAAPSDQTRVRFVARDDEPGSIVEAGVDDFELVRRGCRFAPADLDRSGAVTADDFFAYLALFASRDPEADLTLDGNLTADDFFAYLALFAAA